MNSNAVFLQARIGSTRLRNKATRLISGIPLIVHAMRSLREVPVGNYVLLTDSESASVLTPLATSQGFETFVGAPENVLDRFYNAVLRFRPETIIRATGDNPLVSSNAAEAILLEHKRGGYDYSRYEGLPHGTGVEIVQSEAIVKAKMGTDDPYDLEHVTPYIYKNPKSFNLCITPAPENWLSSLAVTVDTLEELENVRHIFDVLWQENPISIEEIVKYGAVYV